VHTILLLLLLSTPALAQNPPAAPPADEAAAEAPAPAPLAPPVLLGQIAGAVPEGILEPGGPILQVMVELFIDEEGIVLDQTIATSSGSEELDAHCLRLAPLMQFLPATQEGEPVAVTIQYPFRFLPPDPPPPLIPPAQLSGRVEVKGSKEPAAFLDVELYVGTPNREEPTKPEHYDLAEEPTASFTLGDDAVFDLPDLPAGTYVVSIGGGAFKTARYIEVLAEGQTREVLYRVVPTGLDETVVIARREDANPERVLTRDELWKMPGAGGDPVAAIQALPGVVYATPSFNGPPGEQTPIVRGASSEDSVFALDGLPSPVLIHSLGQESITGQYLVDRAYLQPAAAAARFGDLTGAVVGIDIRSPRKDRVGGFIQPGIGQAAAALEGPIADNARFYVGFKRSYFDLFIGLFLPQDSPIDFATAPFWQDQQAIIEADIAPGLNFHLGYIGTTDGIDILRRPGEEAPAEDLFTQRTDLHRIQIKLDLETDWGLTNKVHPAISFWGTKFKFLNFIDLKDRHTTFHLLDELHVPIPQVPWLSFDAGVLLEIDDNRRSSTQPIFAREDTGPTVDLDNDAELSGSERRGRVWVGTWFGATFKPIPELQITPEFRLDYWAALGDPVPGVRARMGYSPTKFLQFSLAGGRYVQSPSLDELNSISGNPELGPEEAWHANVGVNLAPAPWVNIDVQGYVKTLSEQVVSNATSDTFAGLGNGLGGVEDPDDPTNGLSNGGKGRIYGMEVFAKFGVTRGVGVSGWLGYSLAWAERKDTEDEAWRWFQWDRRHQLTALVSLRLPGEVTIGGRWQLQTGAPRTPVIDSTYFADFGSYIPEYGEQNSERAKPYHQLDLRIDKRIRQKTHFVDVFVDVTNVYYAKTDEFPIQSFDYRETASFALIPGIDFGVRVEF